MCVDGVGLMAEKNRRCAKHLLIFYSVIRIIQIQLENQYGHT